MKPKRFPWLSRTAFVTRDRKANPTSTVTPWRDSGWTDHPETVSKSACHDATIYATRSDGVTAGCCSECFVWVVRINPRTLRQEIPAHPTPATTPEKSDANKKENL